MVTQCVKGNENAMKQFYQHFHGYALSICIAYTDNQDDAVEIMNDGFLKAFQSLSKQQNINTLKSWLRRIIVNTAIDHYRRNQHLRNNKSLEKARIYPTKEYGEEYVYAQLSAEEILKQVQQLPAPYRMVFSLYVLEGYSHREIAEKLGIAESTSRSHLSEANNRLRELLTLQAKKNHV
ncbi:RNA polymerase sigma factor [Xanthocytophaga agilis]|uniref:RNA polymerase sigma factor n=1 Tax=Xanthocytophaga agilis TaxID=3048010 RepID=A0AAE3R7N3_9BACT|nr:RNA polymerase sigma factor [Xanthocytophaga agilis]MDJ1502298.1 RNA polymerase sigma factor [Xanthocytophaga agilis]